ncbi:MAG: family 78 glycoside hydrolase catalytic domain, partial [Candidatus Ornithomonoglobus sp.]
GIDIDSCTNVNVFGSYFKTGDDVVILKSGRNKEGSDLDKPNAYVRVTDCFAQYCVGAFGSGSENSGGDHDILFQNIRTENLRYYGFWLKTTKARGGITENIQVRDFDCRNSNAAVYIDYNYSSASTNPSESAHKTRYITFENVGGNVYNYGYRINGLSDLYVTDLVIRGAAFDAESYCELKYCSRVKISECVNTVWDEKYTSDVVYEQEPEDEKVSAPVSLSTENLENPIGIDSAKPKFSWKAESGENGYSQTAYRILVASSEEKLNEAEADMWDSGKVSSSQQYAVVYDGAELSSLSDYCWKVKTYDKDGRESEWSDTASFETAFLNQDEWNTAKLVGGNNAKMVRKTIELPQDKEITSARAYVSSPGYFELHINGEIIGDHVIDPVQTNPDCRLMYPVFDVTDNLKKGENAVGAMLGLGGVCAPTGMRDIDRTVLWDPVVTKDERYLIMQLAVNYADGSRDIFVTDDTWECSAESPVTDDDLYYGEAYDATKEQNGWDEPDFDGSGWEPAAVWDGEQKIMAAQLVPIKVNETITPVSCTDKGGGTFVYDLGKNIAGRPVITVSGNAGDVIEMHFGEVLTSSGYVNYRTTRHDWTCRYTLKGDGEETWSPRFAISGFQYIEVRTPDMTLTTDNIKAELVTAELGQTGSFNSSSDMLNSIHSMYLLSQKANLSTGVPIDCPHRERLGWLGDAMLISDAVSYNYDTANMFAKWFNDMNDEMERSPEIWRNFIPYPSEYGTTDFDVPWFSANIQIPWDVYQAYGDKTVLENSYTRMSKLITDLTDDYTTDYLINKDGAWQDWVSVIGKDNMTPAYLGSGYYYHCVDLMAQIADILGKTEDKEKYEKLAENIRKAINDKWLVDGEYYDTNTQSANALALDFGIVPKENEEAVLYSLVSDLEKRNCHVTTGIPGTYNIFHALSKYGRDDLLYRFMVSESYPGYGYMIANGRTTPWEFWHMSVDAMSSWNHVFLTGPGESWLNRSVAGIAPLKPGYEEFQIKPAVVGDLKSAEGAYESVHGKIVSEWERNDKTVTMNISVPANTTGCIYVPTLGAPADKVTITSGDEVLWRNGVPSDTGDIRYTETDGGYIVFKAGSGDYTFIMTADADVNSSAVHYDKLNADGTEISAQNMSALGGLNGVTLNSWYLQSLDPGDYVYLGEADMTAVSDIQVGLRANWGSDKKAIDFRIDSPTGDVISTLYVVGTKESKAETFHTEAAQCVRKDGTHKLYMTFRGANEICDLSYVKLVKSAGSGTVTGAEPAEVYAAKGAKAELPSAVTVYLSDNTAEKRKVTWDAVTTDVCGSFIVEGAIDGADVKAQLTLTVTDKARITAAENVTAETYAGQLILPVTTKAEYSDGSKRDALVNWEAVDAALYSAVGEFTVNGTIEGYAGTVTAHITVNNISAPDSVRVEQIGDTLELSWKWDGTEDLGNVYFEIQRSADSADWETIGTSSGFWDKESLHYIDNELPQADGVYYYRVRAVTASAESEFSSAVSIDYKFTDLGRVISNGKPLTVSGASTGTGYINDGDIHADHYGYASYGTNQNTDAYIVIDLGESCEISCVKLFPQRNNIGVPIDFTIEASDSEDFAASKVITSQTGYSLPYYKMMYFEAPEGTTGRYVRIYATKLGWMWTSYYALAAEEVQVCSPASSITNDNQLSDGDFEKLTEIVNGGWKPVSGAWRSGLGTSVTIDTENASPNDGSTKSVKITNAAIQQLVSLEKGETYELSFDIYLNSGFDASKLTFGIHNFGGTYEAGMAYGCNAGTAIGDAEITFDASKTGQWQTVT